MEAARGTFGKSVVKHDHKGNKERWLNTCLPPMKPVAPMRSNEGIVDWILAVYFLQSNSEMQLRKFVAITAWRCTNE